jgi:hypothetical protein
MITQMRWLFCAVVVGLAVASRPGLVDAIEEKLTVEQALYLLEAGSKSIRSFDVYFTIEMRGFFSQQVEEDKNGKLIRQQLHKLQPGQSPKVVTSRYRQTWSQGRERLELLSSSGREPQHIYAFDGEIERGLTPAAGLGEIRKPEPFLAIEGMHYRDAYETFTGRIRLLTMLRERSNVVLEGGEARDGVSEIMLSSKPQPKVPGINWAWAGLRLTLDPRHGMLPKEIVRQTDRDAGLLDDRVTQIEKWKKLEDGTWVPVAMVTRFYDTEGQLERMALLNETRLVVDETRSAFNKPIPLEEFTLPFPQGTRVMDRYHNVEFTVGAPDTGKNIDQLLQNAKGVIKVDFSARPETQNPWKLVAVVVLVVMAALLGLLVAVQLIKRYGTTAH